MLQKLMILFFMSWSLVASSQGTKQLNSSEIYEEIQKFNFLGSVLYVAAHPDDENTRLISYVSRGLHARTAYLSLTRGDGGQNLIGTEIRELLGVLRSQELQMARSVDGGQQFFTRANDFGYSKHPDETLEIWNKDQVFSDLIYTIRYFKPDIIINRFDHRTPGKTHGHHTSSAMLSVEAFDKANDPKVYPEQLSKVDLWQPTRQYMNTSWWFYGSRENFAKADKTNLISVDAGAYYPTLGISNNELSALARSKHLSQGFGSAGSRGSYEEYLELLNGDMPADKADLFGDINTTWTRVKGGAAIKQLMDKVVSNYSFNDPSLSVPALLQVYDKIDQVQDDHWKQIKKEELTNLIIQCSGVFLEASVESQYATRGDSIEIMIEATNRSTLGTTISDVLINGGSTGKGGPLESITENKWYHTKHLDNELPFSSPYWLEKKGTLGSYEVSDMDQRIRPESPPALAATFLVDIEGRNLAITRPVIYRQVDPAKGELRKPFALVPPATMSFDREMYLLAAEKETMMEVKVRANKDHLQGSLKLITPNGWKTEPTKVDIKIDKKGFEQSYQFKLIGPKDISEGQIAAAISIDGKSYDKSLINIDYDHIPLQTILLPAEAKLVKVPLKMGGQSIGYVMGAGDKMPESLSSVGYQVTIIEYQDLSTIDLSSFDAIAIGIRAYNKIKNLKLYNEYLFNYAEQGGTLITQYNTSRRLDFDDLAPYPIKLSRKRVTDEYAEVRILKPDHKVMNFPNKIGSADFDNWVQERGLYFPEEWDPQYEAILSCNDKGEDPLDGSLLIAPHGEGYFVYSSISWFRELPAGVPGAYRLFANILALSSDDGK